MPEPIVSVLLAINKDRGRLNATMDSVLTQSLTQLELIVIDDAAPTAVRATLVQGQACDHRVRVVENGAHLGLTRSLNRGLERATGQYIARIDEGDIWLPDKLKMQVAFLDGRPDHVLVGTQYRNYSGADLMGRSGTRLPIQDGDIRRWLFSGRTPVIHPSIMFRRGLLSYNDSAKTSQDFELYLRLSLLGKLHNLSDELLLSYTPTEGIISIDHENLQFSNHVQMHQQFMDVLHGRFDRAAYIECGTDFTRPPPFGATRARYMTWCLGALRRLPKRSLSRRVLRNLLIPDFLIYYLQSRSAQYRFRAAFRSYMDHASHLRS